MHSHLLTHLSSVIPAIVNPLAFVWLYGWFAFFFTNAVGKKIENKYFQTKVILSLKVTYNTQGKNCKAAG